MFRFTHFITTSTRKASSQLSLKTFGDKLPASGLEREFVILSAAKDLLRAYG